MTWWWNLKKASDRVGDVMREAGLDPNLGHWLEQSGGHVTKGALDELKPLLEKTDGLLEKTDGIVSNLTSTLTTLFPGGDVINNFFGHLTPLLSQLMSQLISGATNMELIAIAGFAVNKIVGGAVDIGVDYMKTRSRKELIRLISEKVQLLVNTTFNRIDKVVSDVAEIVKARLKEFSDLVIKTLEKFGEMLDQIERIADKFTPEAFYEGLIKPTLDGLEEIRQRAFDDLDRIVDKIFVESNALMDKFFDNSHNLVDQIEEVIKGETTTQWIHRIAEQTGNLSLTETEYYESIQKNELAKLSKLTSNSTIEDIVIIYGQLQLNAKKMIQICRGVDTLRRSFLQDFIYYGQKGEFWSSRLQKYQMNYLEV